jgi:NADPH-dependent 2,4-dienoyl-CoA reductase/sulfur reductase-like enzyme
VELSYDRLVIATGAEPIRPPIAGLELEGVHLLHTVEDSMAVRERVLEHSRSRALVVGGGYIGLEVADALVHRGLEVILVEQAETVMPTVDSSLGRLIGQELRRHGVEVVNGVAIQALEASADGITAVGSQAFTGSFDLILVAVGVRPASRLAKEAGLSAGVRDAIRVNRRMETESTGVYAAGDCVETWHRLLQSPVYPPLGRRTLGRGPGRRPGMAAPSLIRPVPVGGGPMEPRWRPGQAIAASAAQGSASAVVTRARECDQLGNGGARSTAPVMVWVVLTGKPS